MFTLSLITFDFFTDVAKDEIHKSTKLAGEYSKDNFFYYFLWSKSCESSLVFYFRYFNLNAMIPSNANLPNFCRSVLFAACFSF